MSTLSEQGDGCFVAIPVVRSKNSATDNGKQRQAPQGVRRTLASWPAKPRCRRCAARSFWSNPLEKRTPFWAERRLP
jgi:hypothetical protein